MEVQDTPAMSAKGNPSSPAMSEEESLPSQGKQQDVSQHLAPDVRTEASLHMLQEFLLSTQRAKQAALAELTEQLRVLKHDIARIAALSTFVCESLQPTGSSSSVPAAVPTAAVRPTEYEGLGKKRRLDEMEDGGRDASASNDSELATSCLKRAKHFSASPLMRKQCERIELHADELRATYFASRSKVISADLDHGDGGLSVFADDLADIARYTRLRTVASLDYAHGLYNTGSCIVSSIDFNKDDEFFATAGVTKRIKIFDYRDVMADMRQEIFGSRRKDSNGKEARDSDENVVPITEHRTCSDENADEEDEEKNDGDQVPRFPVLDMGCESKISGFGLSIGTLPTRTFSPVEVMMPKVQSAFIRKGSNEKSLDVMVVHTGKFWSVNERKAVGTVQSSVNLCTVKWNPEHHSQVAFGSADHHIHYYDIRNLASPLHVFQGHSKAVSYVNFVNANTLLSCSTDSTLRAWDVAESIRTGESKCTQTYTGHVNVKNFVGMSIDSKGEYIACGSETDEVHVYWKWLSRPVVKREMDGARDPITVKDE
ncbi:hypothetical protein HDU86_005576 [Geranomyces michiganensis]|nr:hypothetical protein HDU86_005576 [Geranomyces michiganensis]